MGEVVSVEVWVGADRASLTDAIRGAWAVRQTTRRRKDGEAVCFRVRIEAPSVDFTLATMECGRGGGGGRSLTRAEQQILELWEQHRLNELEYEPGQALAFLRQLERLLE